VKVMQMVAQIITRCVHIIRVEDNQRYRNEIKIIVILKFCLAIL